MIGQTISHYKVLEKIGEGGMGVVYKAEDTRLDRVVALKFLSAHLLENEVARERFVHEAKAAATLDHPNICTVYEIDEADGETFLAMAYIEGPTLTEKIDQRPLKVKPALDFAIQIGQGLQAAHERGINHRDIKPPNVILSADGQIKVMDFGLAHLGGRTKITKTGVVLGTPSYMAPEQLRGERTDQRADIWSFGVVLHEMITGQPPFEGETEESVSYAILHTEPEPLTALRSGLPVELDRIVAKSLAKDPGERYQHMDEMLVDLRALRKRLPETTQAPTDRRSVLAEPRPALRLLPWILCAVLGILLAAALWSMWRSGGSGESSVARVSVDLPDGCRLTPRAPLAIAPDGGTLAFTATCDGVTQLYLRRLDQYAPQPVAGSDGAATPFFSPDGTWVGFFSGGQLKRAPAIGGEATTICGAGDGHGGSWGRDGNILFSSDQGSGLQVVPATGGVPRDLTTPDSSKREVGHNFPEILPSGKAAIFTIRQSGLGFSRHPVAVVDLASGEYRVLLEDSTAARYSETGRLLHYRRGSVFASAFDTDRLELAGEPSLVLEDVAPGGIGNIGSSYAVSRTGALAYVPARERQVRFVWVGRDGSVEQIPLEPRACSWLDLSPDGKRFVTMIRSAPGEGDIWVCDIERGTLSRVTSEGTDHAPVWTNDGERVIFASSRGGPEANLHWKRADGQGEAERLLQDVHHQDPVCFGPDGKTLVFVQYDRDTEWDIWLLDTEGGSEPRPFLQSTSLDLHPALSPDGRWLAYDTGETGRQEVYVQPFPEGGRRWQISTHGGEAPLWSPNGEEIFYWSGNNLMAVPVSGTEQFQAGQPNRLFSALPLPPVAANLGTPGRPPYDVAPDGQRFLMLQPLTPDSPPREQLRLVLNWADELR